MEDIPEFLRMNSLHASCQISKALEAAFQLNPLKLQLTSESLSPFLGTFWIHFYSKVENLFIPFQDRVNSPAGEPFVSSSHSNRLWHSSGPLRIHGTFLFGLLSPFLGKSCGVIKLSVSSFFVFLRSETFWPFR